VDIFVAETPFARRDLKHISGGEQFQVFVDRRELDRFLGRWNAMAAVSEIRLHCAQQRAENQRIASVQANLEAI